jgi:A/G-specific adenine glycosylase
VAAPWRSAVVRALLAHLARSARALPWREARRDPYRVWISEVMLQQTRVATVVPYFEAFVRRFPDVRAVARADLDEVLAVWSGLGYYRRARALHAAARLVVQRHAGALPTSLAELRALPGVGAYTAAAIGSIALGMRVAVVDGNVRRVLARLLALRDPVASPRARARIEAVAARLVPARSPGAFNEAVMELGATVCTPAKPRCACCPLARLCESRRLGLEDTLPARAPPRVPATTRLGAIVAVRRGRVLLARRAARGRFGGLWEPPMFDGPGSASRRALATLGAGAQVRRLGVVRHDLTNRRLCVHVLRARVREDPSLEARDLGDDYVRLAWVAPERIGSMGVSTLARKVLAVACAGSEWRTAGGVGKR